MESLLYQTIASRRMQWDNLVWQVPVLSLTAQAFLFSIALGSDSSSTARIFSCTLSILVSFLCVSLMARHRQAEFTDAEWLGEFEKKFTSEVPQHGLTWKDRRDAMKPDGNGLFSSWIFVRPQYRVWSWGLLAFAIAAVAVVAVTIWFPALLG